MDNKYYVNHFIMASDFSKTMSNASPFNWHKPILKNEIQVKLFVSWEVIVIGQKPCPNLTYNFLRQAFINNCIHNNFVT